MAAASSNTTFPFLSLAPELRNRIYELALHHNRLESGVANTSLLRVNKQINHECKDLIFESPNIFTLNLTCTAKDPWDVFHEVNLQLSGDLKLTYAGDLRMIDLRPVFPEHMFKFGEIVVMVNLPRDDYPNPRSWRREYLAARMVLRQTAMTLNQEGHQVTKLRVKFCEEVKESVPKKESQFRPDVALLRGVEVVFE